MKPNLQQLTAELRKLGNKTKAKSVAGYFKTGPGHYGEGDIFLGVTVPEQRTLAKKFAALPPADIEKLLQSSIHEFRLTALLILVAQYQKADATLKKRIANFYLKHRRQVNNWDLVDTSAPYILGDYLFDRNKEVLYKLCRSRSVWDRRIAILATYGFIKQGVFKDTLAMAKLLLDDSHDLMHKAVGWMLREVGNRDHTVETKFLDQHAHRMPRTMLRYAIEKFDGVARMRYLRGSKKKKTA